MCVRCDWQEFLERIEGMIESDEFDWAEDTLNGIYETVLKMEHKTPGQEQAIDNISAAGTR